MLALTDRVKNLAGKNCSVSLFDIKNERKVFDSVVLLVAAISAYLTGYFQVLDMGAVTVTLMMPNVFLIGLAFLHLVFRKGRKFDRKEHRLSYEGLKTLVFAGMAYTSYQSGLSTTQNSFFPGNIGMAFVSVIFIASGIYLMAYRANL
jgi:hypothetical protein